MKHTSSLAKLLLAGWLSACGDGAANQASFETISPGAEAQAKSTSPAGNASGAGVMEVRLVDAPADEVKEIVVTITRVEGHVAGGGGWMVLGEKEGTIDLLKLQGGTFAQLGVVKMPPGKVTQLRLYVKEAGPNYVTTPDGKQHPLTVPSGPQSGIKIKGGFEWPACGVGNVTIDFDGKKSIFTHPKGAGAGDEWILRPVVRVHSVSVKGDACAPGSDAGVPSDLPTPPPSDAGTPTTDMPTTPPVMTTPPGDPCASVTCATGLYCYNGACLQDVD